MIELTPALDAEAGEALYIQLYRYIRDAIAAGDIAADARLPSVRLLAGHLGISRTPVAAAYEQLLAEGYIRSKPRSGFFVAVLETPPAGPRGRRAADDERLALTSPQRSYHAARNVAVRYDFGYGNIDLRSFPLAKWRRLINRALLLEHADRLLYGDWQGEPELRSQIAAYLLQLRGVRCAPEQIVVGAGTYHLLELLFQLLRGDVRRMAAEEAVNDGVKALFGQYPFEVRPLRLESDGISIDELRGSGAQAVYVTPSHQFPFGMTLSAGKRLRLLHWAQENGAYIIENDYDGEFRYGGKSIPSLQSLDDGGRVVYIGTFSKILLPAFRLGYLVLPYQLLDKFRRRGHSSFDQLASPIFQQALHSFMQTGDFERHVRKMRGIYQRKHDAVLRAICNRLGDVADVIGAGSGLHIVLHVRAGMSEDELVRSAGRLGVSVYPVSGYRLVPAADAPPAVLLGFGGLDETEIDAAVGLLAAAWKRKTNINCIK